MTTALGIRPASGTTLTAGGPPAPDRHRDACWTCGTVYGALRQDPHWPGQWICPKCSYYSPETYGLDTRSAYALIVLLELSTRWTLRAHVAVAEMVARDLRVRAWHDLDDATRATSDGRRFAWVGAERRSIARHRLDQAATHRFGYRPGGHLR